MKRILCLWLPHWPLQRLAVDRPELKGRPLVLHERDPRRGRRVTDCSQAAWRQGVRPGMTAAEASALFDPRGAAPQLAPSRPEADRRALEDLAAWCDRFSPRVGLEEGSHPECLFLDVAGLGPLFGGELPLARQVIHDLAQRGLAARAAVADTIGAAWGVCRHGATSSGPVVVPPGELWSALAPLPIEALRLSPATAGALRRLGISCVAQAAALPREALASRLPRAPAASGGASCELLARLDQALGSAEELLTPHREPPEFFADRPLEYPLERREAIEAALESLLEEISRRLVRRRRGAVRLACRLDCAQAPLWLEVDLYRPAASPRRLMELARLRLDRMRLPGPVGRIGVAVELAAPLEERQAELFAGSRQESADALAALVERLSGRLGRERVLRPRLAADPLPELACRYVPWTGVAPRPVESTETAPRPFALGERPLAAQARPTPIAVVAIAPLGPPISFRWQGRHFRVARFWGPERIETGWWRGPLERRDYYRVETPSGARHWLFRRLNDGQWFLQGRFE